MGGKDQGTSLDLDVSEQLVMEMKGLRSVPYRVKQK